MNKFFRTALMLLPIFFTISMCSAQAVYVPPSGTTTYPSSPPSNSPGTVGVPAYSSADGAILENLLDPLPAGTNYIGKVAQQGSWTVLGTFWPYSLGQNTMLNSVPVTIANNQSALPVTGTFYQSTQPVSIATMPTTPVTGVFWPTTQPVSIATLPSLVAGSAAIGTVGVTSLPALSAGSAAIGSVSISSLPSITGTVIVDQGTGGNLHVDVDSAPTTTVSGTVAISGTVPISGTVTVNPLPTGSNTIGNVNLAGTPTVNANAGTGTFAVSAAALPLPSGAATATNQTAARSAPGTPQTQAITIQGNASGIAVPVTGTFYQGTQPVSGTVTANVGTGTQSSNVTQINGNTIVTGGSNGLIAVGGPVASAGTNASNPVKIGGVFNTTQPTVTNGQIVDTQATSRGAVIVASGVDPINVTTIASSALNQVDTISSGGITSNQTVTVSTQGASSVFIVVSGTWTGTLQPQVSYDGTNWVNISVVPSNPANISVTTITSNGQYDIPIGGINQFRILGNTVATGTATTHVEASVGAFGIVTRQSVAANLNATVVTTGGATVAQDTSVTGLQVTQGSTTSGQKGELNMGAVTTGAPTYTTAQSSPLSLTTSGALRTDASATTQPISAASLPLPTGAALDTSVNGLLVSLGSTTSGQKGTLAVGAVTTSAPTYTTAQTSALSLTTAGALRVDGSGVTQPVSGTVTSNTGGYTYTHIASNTTTVVKSGTGVLHIVTINTPGTADTATIYDNTAGSGTVMAVINDASTSAETLTYDITFNTGCTIVTTGTTSADISVATR